MDKKTVKTNVTVAEDTKEWLEQEYPDALTLQEAIRTALSDARTHQTVIKTSSVSLNKE